MAVHPPRHGPRRSSSDVMGVCWSCGRQVIAGQRSFFRYSATARLMDSLTGAPMRFCSVLSLATPSTSRMYSRIMAQQTGPKTLSNVRTTIQRPQVKPRRPSVKTRQRPEQPKFVLFRIRSIFRSVCTRSCRIFRRHSLSPCGVYLSTKPSSAHMPVCHTIQMENIWLGSPRAF